MICQLSDEYYVRALRESDLEGPYPSWFEDQEVCRYNSHGKFFKSLSSFRDYLRKLDSEDQVVWAICHHVDGHIGNIGLQALSFIDRSAEFAIILGDRRHWHKGVARLAAMALLSHGFNKLNLERVSCGTAATNEGMKKLALEMGMTLEGTRRDQLFLDGRRVDVLEFGLLRQEFKGTESS